MKVVVFLLLASSYSLAYPVVKTWNLNELSRAVEKMIPAAESNPVDHNDYPLFDAFNLMMHALYTGEENESYVMTMLLSPSGSKDWTKHELEKAMGDPNTNPDLLPLIIGAHRDLTMDLSKHTAQVWVPALDISTWTLSDVITAKHDPNVKGAMVDIVEGLHKKFKEAALKGETMETASITTPVGLILQAGVKPTFVPKEPVKDPYIIGWSSFQQSNKST